MNFRHLVSTLLLPIALLVCILLTTWYSGGITLLSTFRTSNVYNRTLALYLVEHASAVYVDSEEDLVAWNCSRCQGVTTGFHTVTVIVDEPKILQAYVGISEALGSVVVAFRGTRQRSILNWWADLYFLELNLSYPGVESAFVHGGFYASYHNTSIRNGVLEAVSAALVGRPELGVAVTGHSLGAALACLCALDLTVNLGIPDVKMMTFGQPRVGNKMFAQFFNSQVKNSVRMTHGHDPVPHLPPPSPFGGTYSYYHVATEVWIYSAWTSDFRQLEVEKVCDSSGEDPSCCRSVLGTSIMDHLQYLGVPLNFHLDSVPQALAPSAMSGEQDSVAIV